MNLCIFCRHGLTWAKDIAESVNVPTLPEAVASALASDVEYRIHQVVDVGKIKTKFNHNSSFA